MMKKTGKILVGMSGGLDSTYSVRLLEQEGWEVIGAALIFSDHTDISAARKAAQELSIPLVEENVRSSFEKTVMRDFAESYRAGRTPNPCVVCNRYVKMETLHRLSLALGCDKFATGHYAEPMLLENGRYAIGMGQDRRKDQSYMLWGMTQEQISRFVAPLARLEKSEIRKMAQNEGLSASKTEESQDICFIPDGDYVSFLRRYASDGKGFEEGYFVDTEGKRLGKHQGLVHYTVGQRKGLGIALGYPAFVTDMDPVTGYITLSPAEKTYKKKIVLDSLVFQGLPETEAGSFSFDVKIRYGATPAPCRLTLHEGWAEAEFETAQRNPAPGQSAVFYREDVVMLGGVIRRES